MKKTGIFYGSTTGYTADVADRIAKALGVELADVYNVADTKPSTVGDYDRIILGSSTWGSGDLQDDFADFLDGIEALALEGKEVAVFGCGDESMTDTFCNAVGEIYRRVKNTGATMIGAFNTDGYEFEHSDSVVDGQAVGLMIDDVNHPELTDARIKAWAEELA